jgi:hypothetical protein
MLDLTLLPVCCLGAVALMALLGVWRILTTDPIPPEEEDTNGNY